MELEAAPRKWLDPGSIPEHEAMLTLQNSGGTWSFSQLWSTVPGNGTASLAVAHAFRVLRDTRFLSRVGQRFRERPPNESRHDSDLSLSDSKKPPPPQSLDSYLPFCLV